MGLEGYGPWFAKKARREVGLDCSNRPRIVGFESLAGPNLFRFWGVYTSQIKFEFWRNVLDFYLGMNTSDTILVLWSVVFDENELPLLHFSHLLLTYWFQVKSRLHNNLERQESHRQAAVKNAADINLCL